MTNERIESLISQILAGDKDAREQLAEFIVGYVAACRLPQLGPYCRDPDYRAEVCARVVTRFLVGECERLAVYKQREKRNFRTLLRVVINRVTIDLARSISQNIGQRGSGEFRWVREHMTTEFDQVCEGDLEARSLVRAVDRYLDEYSDPIAVALLRARVFTTEQWSQLARRYDLTEDAARQRVRRLRQRLRDWRERMAT